MASVCLHMPALVSLVTDTWTQVDMQSCSKWKQRASFGLTDALISERVCQYMHDNLYNRSKTHLSRQWYNTSIFRLHSLHLITDCILVTAAEVTTEPPPPECPDGKEYRKCGPLCPYTCDSYFGTNPCFSLRCAPAGCYCPDQHVMADGRCTPAKLACKGVCM